MDESGSYPEMEGEARYAEERKDAPASEAEVAEIPTESTETSADALEPHLLELRGIPIEDAEKAKAARKDFVIRGDLEKTWVLEGDFDHEEGNELFVFSPGKAFDVYSTKRRIAQTKSDLDPTHAQIKALGIEVPVVASELVRDGLLEVVIYGVRTEGEVEVLEVQVMKVIDEFVAIVFRERLAEKSGETWEVLKSVEFTRGQRHRFVLVRDAGDDSGAPEVYRWNQWEGMYRVPYIPGTAPTSPEVGEPQASLRESLSSGIRYDNLYGLNGEFQPH